MFKWSCLALAVLSVAALLWIVNDVRLEVKHNAETIREKLPEILANTKRSTDTLADVAGDIKQLRELAGLSGNHRDRSLVAYATAILDDLEKSNARIGLTKKVFGSGLKELVPAAEWVVAARKEAIWLTFNANSRQEMLKRLCQNKFGSDWYIEFDNQNAEKLIDWVQSRHPLTEVESEKSAE